VSSLSNESSQKSGSVFSAGHTQLSVYIQLQHKSVCNSVIT